MSFSINDNSSKIYAPGWFLADNEDCTRETREIATTRAVTAPNGGKYVKGGTFYPANNSSTVVGIVYEDVDVTSGAMPGSVVTSGTVFRNRLAETADSGVESALEALGFKFIDEPAVTRPNWTNSNTLAEITVDSAAGTAAGDTAITISDYTPGSSESYVYKVDTDAAPVVYGMIPDYSWTSWDGSSDITATTGKKITIVSVDGSGHAVAAGSATVTAK